MSRHSLISWTLILTFFLPFASRAENLDDIALKLLTGSLSYKSGNYALESESLSLKTSSNLPDPEIGGEYLVAPADESNRWAAELSWGLEWPGVYGARGKEADMKMTAARAALNHERAQQLLEIKTLLIDYIQCRLKLDLLEELNRNNDTIYRLAENAAKGGELTVLDLNKVRLEYANIRGAKAALTDEENEIISQLSRLHGNDCTSIIESLDCEFPEIDLPSVEALEAMKSDSPAVRAAKAEAEVAKTARKVAKMEALPSLSVGYKHAFEEGIHFNGAILGVSIPIFSSKGKQKAAKADIFQADYKAEVAAQEVDTEVKQTWKRLRQIDEQIKEIAPVMDNSDYNSTLLKAYQGGVITLIEYLTDRNYFTNAAIELVSLRHAAALALAKLQSFSPLEIPNP